MSPVRCRVAFDRYVGASAARRALVEADRVAWLDRVLANDHRVDGYVFFNSEGPDHGI